MDLLVIATIALGHFVGDFVVQTRWQAENKSRSMAAMMSHVLTYGTILLPVAWGIEAIFGVLTFYWWVLNIVAHLGTDMMTSQLTKKYWLEDNNKAFFTTIGFDQMLHTVFLFGSAVVMLGL